MAEVLRFDWAPYLGDFKEAWVPRTQDTVYCSPNWTELATDPKIKTRFGGCEEGVMSVKPKKEE